MSDHRDDELLARILRDEADAVHPSADWDDVRERAQGRRRWWIPSAAAVVVLILVAAAVFALGGDDDDRGVIADDPGATTLPEPSTTETTMPPASTSTTRGTRMEAGPEVEPLDLPSGEPLGEDEIVASIEVPSNEIPGVEVVVLSKSSGDVLRTLAAGFDLSEGGVYGFTLTPDQRTALYVVSTAACTARIEAVAVDGSGDPVPVVDDGNHVAVSPDGSQLAVDTGDICTGRPQIDVVPVAGGQSTQYPDLGAEGVAIESVTFADNDTLLFTTTSTPDVAGRLHTLSLSSGRHSIRIPDDGTRYTALARHGEIVSALQSCCDAEGTGDTDLITWRGPEIDPEDGFARAFIDRRPVDVDDIRFVQSVELDPSGVLVVVQGRDEPVLSIDGRQLRDDVLDIGF